MPGITVPVLYAGLQLRLYFCPFSPVLLLAGADYREQIYISGRLTYESHLLA